jgi:hemerythrin-like domain-containing protein
VNSRKKLKKGLISYYIISGITCLQKHFDVEHLVIYKKIQEEINNQGRKNVEKQLAKKKAHISNFSIFDFFASKDPFKKDDVKQKMFMENLALLIVKNLCLCNLWRMCGLSV